VTDITKRKRLEEQIREGRERFEALFENANELIITTDPYGYIKRINKKIEEVSGYTRKEMLGKSILMIAHPDDKDLFIEFWKEILSGKAPSFELRAVSRNGDTSYLLASGSVVKKADKIVEIQYNAQVISDLKKAQRTIEDLSNQLNSIFESSPNVIICLDRSGKIQMANPVTSRIFHKSPSSTMGREISFLSPEMEAFGKIIAEVQEQRVPRFFHERPLSGLSGQFFDVSIYPLMNSGHGGVVFTAVDITEKKNMEIQLIHAQKMETIGELAGGVAHDFNNILTGISGNLAMLKFTPDKDKQLKYIETLEKITERARDLIQQMLVFTKRNEGKPENISIHQVIQEVMGMASKSVPKSISFDIGKIDDDLKVFIDHTQLTQVILNLIVNAKDAIGDEQKGRIAINVQTIHVDKNLKRQFLFSSVGKYIKIDVADNGCGMVKGIIPKIFDPFFSTKQKGTSKGTGLGLSITYNIVKNAGGCIQVHSEEGKGSCFSVYLPISKTTKKASEQGGKSVEKSKINKARILLVDDEDMLRDIGKEMLEYLGHEVETASDGNGCMDMLKSDACGFDIVILDMIMPGLDGYHTLQEMQRCGIDTKVIISSGFSFEHEKEEILSNPLIVAKLNKPFNMEELSSALFDILN
jgi:two-component system, cell cycle sensor histidine kinase and response regulator CckA